jgi:hypothetical protein
MWEAGGKLFLREWKLFPPMTRRKKKERECHGTNKQQIWSLNAHFMHILPLKITIASKGLVLGITSMC